MGDCKTILFSCFVDVSTTSVCYPQQYIRVQNYSGLRIGPLIGMNIESNLVCKEYIDVNEALAKSV